MKKQSEKRQTAIKQIGDLHPIELMSRVFDFSAIYEDFKSSKAEFVIFIREKKSKSHHNYTVVGFIRTLESIPDDALGKYILEYVKKNVAKDTVPAVFIDRRNKTVLFLSLHVTGNKMPIITIKG